MTENFADGGLREVPPGETRTECVHFHRKRDDDLAIEKKTHIVLLNQPRWDGFNYGRCPCCDAEFRSEILASPQPWGSGE